MLPFEQGKSSLKFPVFHGMSQDFDGKSTILIVLLQETLCNFPLAYCFFMGTSVSGGSVLDLKKNPSRDDAEALWCRVAS